MEQQPELFSIALAAGNKATVGFRSIPVTTADWEQLLKFLEILKTNLVNDEMASYEAKHVDTSVPPVSMANAGRVLRGHIPTEVDLANAAERIAARENFQSVRNSMEQERQQVRHLRKSSTESGNDSPSS